MGAVGGARIGREGMDGWWRCGCAARTASYRSTPVVKEMWWARADDAAFVGWCFGWWVGAWVGRAHGWIADRVGLGRGRSARRRRAGGGRSTHELHEFGEPDATLSSAAIAQPWVGGETHHDRRTQRLALGGGLQR